MDVVVRVLERHGLSVNLAKGKTEAIIHLVGSRSRTIVADLGPAGGKTLTTPSGNTVCIVDEYVHLGTVRRHDGDVAADAKRRAKKCDETYEPLAFGVFGNGDVKTSTRLSLATSLCMSRLAHGTDTYVRRSLRAEATLNKARMRVYRRIEGHPRFEAGGLTDREVVNSLGVLPTDLWLLRRRLLALTAQLGNQAPALVRMLRRRQGSPAQEQLAKDLEVAKVAFTGLQNMPDPRCDWRKWLRLIQDGSRWRTALNSCNVEMTGFGRVETKYVNVTAGMDKSAEHICDLCPSGRSRVCKSAAALASHKRCAHGFTTVEVDMLRRQDDPRRCPECHVRFGSTWLAAQHMRDTSCRELLDLRCAR